MKYLVRFLLSFIILSLSVSTFASQEVLIKAKGYLDVTSGKVIMPATILVQGKYIKEVNPPMLPREVATIEKPNLILMPGFIDAHTHFTTDLDKGWENAFTTEDDAIVTLRGAKNLNNMLQHGFTTVRSCGQIYPVESFVDVALANASEKGWIAAPHVIPAGHALGITGGHLDPEMSAHYKPELFHLNYRLGIVDGADEARKSTRYQIKHGAKVIKIAATAGVLSEEESVGAQQLTDDEMKAIVQEAARHHVPVAAHAHGTEGIKAAIKAGVRSIEHGSMVDDEAIRMMKKNGTYLVSTTYLADNIDLKKFSPIMQQKAHDLMPKAKKNLSKAIRSGVKVVLGTDVPVIPFNDESKEFAALVSRGMKPVQAIQAGTITAAELLQLQDRGQIKEGMLADIVGVEADPTQDISTLENVKFVMKAGKVYKG